GIQVRGPAGSAAAIIAWNMNPIPDAPYFKDSRVRWAMSHAVDYERLLKELCFDLCEPATGIYNPGAWMADPTIRPLKQDLDKAEELLDQAGWIDTDADGVRDRTIDGKKWRFEFTTLVGQGGELEKYLALLQGSLQNIGVQMHIQ